MVTKIVITTILCTVGLILLNELYVFWHDRTRFGNAIVLAATGFVCLWFCVGLKQLWFD